MTLKETEALCNTKLKNYYSESEAASMTRLLLSACTAFPLHKLTILANENISPEQQQWITTRLELLLQQQPIQYVLEEAWFYKFPFYVNSHVLIPRPETEELVQLVLTSMQELQLTAPSILEIGTGSGCIAISIKKELPAATVTAIDISPDALHVAQKNAHQLGVAIQFKELDFLNESAWGGLAGDFDCIVSNPPYIAHGERDALPENVLHFEPHLALFPTGDDPLIFYKKIAVYGKSLKHTPCICCEINERFGEDTRKIFKESAYMAVTTRKDMQQKDRMLLAK